MSAAFNFYGDGRFPSFDRANRHQLVRAECRRANQRVISLTTSWIERYKEVAEKDFEFATHTLWDSFPVDDVPNAKLNFACSKLLVVRALAELNSPSEAVFCVSLGMFFSLEDLLFRLVCNQDFFAYTTKGEGYPGCICLWLSNGSVHPQTRFYDYHHQQTKIAAIGSPCAWLTGFFSAIPSDNERYALALMMHSIAGSWVLLHERQHFWEGHLHLQSELEIRHGQKVFTSSTPTVTQAMRRAFEWQADRNATKKIIDYFVNPDALLMLPTYCKQNPAWFLRLLIVSMGSVLLLFHKATSINGSKSEYPSPQSRIFNMVRMTTARWKENEGVHGMSLSLEEILDTSYWALHDLNVASELLADEDAVRHSRSDQVAKSKESTYLFPSPREVAQQVYGTFDPNSIPPHILEGLELAQEYECHAYDMLAPYRKMACNQDIHERAPAEDRIQDSDSEVAKVTSKKVRMS